LTSQSLIYEPLPVQDNTQSTIGKQPTIPDEYSAAQEPCDETNFEQSIEEPKVFCIELQKCQSGTSY
jgi:hypothetical protein